jgi:glucokinase
MAAHYIGIDIGGTNIKAARTTHVGAIVSAASATTPTTSLDDLVATVTKLVETLRGSTAIQGVGVGIPGLLTAATRTVQTSPNIPCLKGVHLEGLLLTALSLPVVTENDANAAAYGEWISGAGRGRQHMVYLTLGTGLGCGLVIAGKLYRGISGYAGEMGHTVVEPDGRTCGCGSRGCLETRVSATGIVLTAREHGIGDPSLSASSLYQAAVSGDSGALSVFQETGRFLGIACANLINLLNPEVIVIGGGVMASGELLLTSAREEVRRRAFGPSAADCPIVQSQLWPDAGTIGGAMLARDAS